MSILKNKLGIIFIFPLLFASCADNALFFVGTPATQEEKLEFYNKIGQTNLFFSDGWYSLEEKHPFSDFVKKCSYKFEIASKLEYGVTKRYIKSFTGKRVTGPITWEYYFNNSHLLQIYTDENGVKRFGANYANLEFDSFYSCFETKMIINPVFERETYIKNSTLCISSSGLLWSYKYDKTYKKLLKIKTKTIENNKEDNKTRSLEVTPCKPFNFNIDFEDYDEPAQFLDSMCVVWI